jgi:hypothetical protein
LCFVDGIPGKQEECGWKREPDDGEFRRRLKCWMIILILMVMMLRMTRRRRRAKKRKPQPQQVLVVSTTTKFEEDGRRCSFPHSLGVI